MKKILLLSDTHGYLDKNIMPFIKNADQVWHAGDIGKLNILETLKASKPIKAVYGNIDSHKIRLVVPEYLYFDCEGLSVLMLHIAGHPGRYSTKAKELIRKHKPNLFVCGHSHILKIMQDKKNGHLHINPGAAGNIGFHNIKTLLRFEISNGKINNIEAIELGLRGALSNTVN